LQIITEDKKSLRGKVPLAEETAEWWKWILSCPAKSNPLKGFDFSYEHLPSIYLSCTGGGEDISRTIRIPMGITKDVLVPIFTSEYCTGELGAASTDADLLEAARDDVKDPIELGLNIDGTEVNSLSDLYLEYGPFYVTLPPGHILGNTVSAGKYRAYCAGYWLKLDSFSDDGSHSITFGGTGRNGFHTKVGYSVLRYLSHACVPLVKSSF
jgi:hypothetical protein